MTENIEWLFDDFFRTFWPDFCTYDARSNFCMFQSISIIYFLNTLNQIQHPELAIALRSVLLMPTAWIQHVKAAYSICVFLFSFSLDVLHEWLIPSSRSWLRTSAASIPHSAKTKRWSLGAATYFRPINHSLCWRGVQKQNHIHFCG